MVRKPPSRDCLMLTHSESAVTTRHCGFLYLFAWVGTTNGSGGVGLAFLGMSIIFQSARFTFLEVFINRMFRFPTSASPS